MADCGSDILVRHKAGFTVEYSVQVSAETAGVVPDSNGGAKHRQPLQYRSTISAYIVAGVRSHQSCLGEDTKSSKMQRASCCSGCQRLYTINSNRLYKTLLLCQLINELCNSLLTVSPFIRRLPST